DQASEFGRCGTETLASWVGVSYWIGFGAQNDRIPRIPHSASSPSPATRSTGTKTSHSTRRPDADMRTSGGRARDKVLGLQRPAPGGRPGRTRDVGTGFAPEEHKAPPTRARHAVARKNPAPSSREARPRKGPGICTRAGPPFAPRP